MTPMAYPNPTPDPQTGLRRTGFKASQMVAATAVVIALLGGAYAIGRSQQPEPALAAPVAAATTAAPATAPAAKAPVVMAAPAVKPAPNRPAAPTAAERERAALVSLCDGCARVTAVRTETREGEASALGTVGGAVIGGLLGNQIGGGDGKKIATVGGAVAGGYAGREIEKRQRSRTVWVIEAKEGDGRLRRFERNADPGLRVGDEIALTDGGFTRR